MSPSLDAVSVNHLTEWDAYIWGRLEVGNKGSGDILAAMYQVADRRDANLMLLLLQSWVFVSSLGCAKVEWRASFRGDVEAIAAKP